MRNQSRLFKYFPRFGLLVLTAFLLSACGGVPLNNYAGISTDGTNVFVANQSYLYEVNSGTAAIEWKYPDKPDASTIFYGAPLLNNGWLYAANYDNVAYGFKLDGLNKTSPSPTWTYQDVKAKGRFIGAPATDGKLVFFPSTDHHLYALGVEDGVMKWSFQARSVLWAPTATDGTLVYQGGLDHYLYAINASDGKKVWETDLGGPNVSGVTLSKDGVAYTGTLAKEVMAIETSSGKILWRQKLEGSLWSAPLLYDGKLYFGIDANKVVILNAADGKTVKTVDAASPIIAAPVVADGAIVFVTENGEIFSLSADGSNKPWTKTVKGNLYTTPVVVNNQIVLSPTKGDQILVGFDFSGNQDQKWNSVAPK